MIFNDLGTGNINLVSHENLKKIIHNVLDDVASVASTLGPGGKTNLVHDSNDTSLYPLKDGYRIVMDMHYDDYFYDATLKIIRDASGHNNTAVGDGTTSSVVILRAFYKKLEAEVENHQKGFEHVSLTGVVNILHAMKHIIRNSLYKYGYIKRLEEYPKDKQKEILEKVATVAANNDKTIGKYVAKLFDKIIDDGNSDELFVDISPNYSRDTDESRQVGFRMNCSYIHRVYTTERDGRTTIYENPRYLLIEGALMDGDLDKLMPIIFWCCVQNDTPLVIMADEYSIDLAQNLYALRRGGVPIPNPDPKSQNKMIRLPELKIVPIQYRTTDVIGHERIQDLEVALGAKAIPARTETWETFGESPEEWEGILGRSQKIMCVPHETSIIGGFGTSAQIEGRIAQIQDDLNHMQYADTPNGILDANEYKERIGMLKSNMVVIRVGGATFKDRQYNCFVYEDAVYACKSTIKNGFTLAGQVSIKHLIKYHSTEIINDTIEFLNKEGRNVTYGKKRREALENAIKNILEVLSDTICVAYEEAIKNAILDENNRNEIFKELYNTDEKNVLVYNLMKDSYEGFDPDNSDLFVAGNTDYETFAAISNITGIFLNTDNLETLYIPRRVRKEDVQPKPAS